MPEYGQMDQNMIDALLGQMQDEDPYGTGLQKQTNPYAWVAPGVGGYDAAGGTLGGGSGWLSIFYQVAHIIHQWIGIMME